MPTTRKLTLALAALLAVLVAVPGPALAQFSDSYKFLEGVRKKDGTVVTQMLDKGSPSLINTRDLSSGESALHIVTARRDLAWMQFLLGHRANPNARNGKGETALVLATNFGFTEGVELLISVGAKVDESGSSGETPLITAVHNRNIGLMRILLAAGASADRTDNSGRTARDYAKLDAKRVQLLGVIDAGVKAKGKPGQAKPVFGPK